MYTRSVDKRQPPSLLEINSDMESMPVVIKFHERLAERIEALGWSQAEAARRCGMSSQRFGNYYQGTRMPDVETLMRVARVLHTSTDWLLGLNAAEPPDVSGVISRLLELEGMPPAKIAAISETVQEALRVLSSLPDEGDALTRSRIAAQAAWQLSGGSKPSQ